MVKELLSFYRKSIHAIVISVVGDTRLFNALPHHLSILFLHRCIYLPMTASLQACQGKRTKISILCQNNNELQTGCQNKERKGQ